MHTNTGVSRRSLIGSVGMAAGMVLPSLFSGGLKFISPAQALGGNVGVAKDQGDLVFIKGSSVPVVEMAEWATGAAGAEAANAANRIAATKEALERAPKDASRYEARTYNFPSGAWRVLTWKKGAPVFHQCTFESEIYVLQGELTLTPLYGMPGKATKVVAGDALYLPSGVLTNAKPAQDTVLLLALVSNTAKKPKSAIVNGRGLTAAETVQWQEGGKDMSATKPEEIRKAPKDAARFSTKRYVFDGNSFRVATFKKGGRTSTVTTNRTDVLMYIAKGRIRRKEGDQVMELVAGDAIREKLGNPGYWEPLEESVFIATDAPMNPANLTPAMVP